MKKLLGPVFVLLGLGLLAWVGYNHFVQMLPAAEGHSPIPPLLFAAGLLYVGVKWARE